MRLRRTVFSTRNVIVTNVYIIYECDATQRILTGTQACLGSVLTCVYASILDIL